MMNGFASCFLRRPSLAALERPDPRRLLCLPLGVRAHETAAASTRVSPGSSSMVAILECTGRRYDDFQQATAWINWLLGPAVVAMAVPIYQLRRTVRANAADALALVIPLWAGVRRRQHDRPARRVRPGAAGGRGGRAQVHHLARRLPARPATRTRPLMRPSPGCSSPGCSARRSARRPCAGCACGTTARSASRSGAARTASASPARWRSARRRARSPPSP